RWHRLGNLEAGRVRASGTSEALMASVPLALYRAWGDDVRAIARAARTLPYVQAARATGRFVRVEVLDAHAPDPERVLRDLAALPGGHVRLAEPVPVDMETTLLALSSP